MIDLQLRTSKDVVAREQGSVYCEITVAPQGLETTRRRTPVALVLCIDRSGSMAGTSGRPTRGSGRQLTKVEHARAAAEQAVSRLLDGDCIGLVTFSSDVRADLQLTEVDDITRAAVVAYIRAIEPEASTNLAGGIGIAAGLFGPEHRRQMPCKIVVLSDGLANVGISDPHQLAELAREHAANGITISALGVGEDYSAETMSGIAQATGGEFYHISDAAEIETALAAEVADIKTVAARQTELRITVPPLVALGGNLNLLPQVDVPGGALLRLGDVVRPRQVIIEVATPVEYCGTHLTIDVECSYDDVASGRRTATRRSAVLDVVSAADFAEASPNREVTAGVREMLQARAIRLATAAYERDDVQGAGALLGRAAETLIDMSFSCLEASTGADELHALSVEMAARRLTADANKSHHAAAYARTTSRSRRQPDKPKGG